MSPLLVKNHGDMKTADLRKTVKELKKASLHVIKCIYVTSLVYVTITDVIFSVTQT